MALALLLPQPWCDALRCGQEGQQFSGGQNGVREARSVDLVRRLHALRLEGGGRILNQRGVVARLHAEASGALDAGVRYEADEDDLLDPPLCEGTSSYWPYCLQRKGPDPPTLWMMMPLHFSFSISAVGHYFTGTRIGAPLPLTNTARSFAGLVLLAFRPTT